jgi:hypothetical protein
MWLWFVSLFLKLLSVAFVAERGGLELCIRVDVSFKAPADSEKSPSVLNKGNSTTTRVETSSVPPLKKLEILYSKYGFLLIEGDENLILQFFRPYGHPIRNSFVSPSNLGVLLHLDSSFPLGCYVLLSGCLRSFSMSG